LSLPPHEAALHAAQAAQSAAIDARDALRQLLEIEDRRNEPAEHERIHLSAAQPTREWHPQVDAPTLSIAILNPAAVPIYLGVGNATASATAGAISVPPSSLLVLPLAIAAIEVGVDQGDAATAFAAGELIVYGFRYRSVQPAFLGVGV
jgi:hypothetical protein